MFTIQGKGLRSLLYVAFLLIHLVAVSIMTMPVIVEIRLGSSPLLEGVGYLLLLGFLLYYLYLWREMKKGDKLEVSSSFTILSYKWLPFVGYLLLVVLEAVLPLEKSLNQTYAEQMVAVSPVLMGLNVVIFAPFAEELLFRKLPAVYLFPNMKTGKSLLAYILITSTIFSLFHTPTTVEHFFLYFSMGAILAWTYVTFKDIRVSMGLHFANNFIGLILMFLL